MLVLVAHFLVLRGYLLSEKALCHSLGPLHSGSAAPTSEPLAAFHQVLPELACSFWSRTSLCFAATCSQRKHSAILLARCILVAPLPHFLVLRGIRTSLSKKKAQRLTLRLNRYYQKEDRNILNCGAQ